MTTYANVGHILLKRGNTSQSTAYTGPLGEMTIDTGLFAVRIHNGVTPGGNIILENGSQFVANLATAATNITTLFANAATQTTLINTINANIIAVNAAIITANTTQSNQITVLQSQLTGANAAIVTANTALKSYTDNQISTAINNLVDSAPGTLDTLAEIAANLLSSNSAIGSIVNSITGTNANVTAANVAIVTANTAMKGYVDAVSTAWAANAATQAGLITTLQSNAGIQADAITSLTANSGVQADAITSLQANITAANLAIAAASGTYSNTNVAAYLSASTTGNVGAGNLTVVNNFNTNVISANSFTYANGASILAGIGGTYTNSNVAAYLPTYTGNIAGNIVKNGYTWRFGTDGNLTFPDATVQTTAYTGADNQITNTDGNSTWAVSVANTGVISMTTGRGGIEFGAMPEPGGPTHFHIMRPADENGSGGTDLYFGDDYNYVLQRPAAYGGAPGYGVEIGANDNNGGDQQVWRFGTAGNLTLPSGGTIAEGGGISGAIRLTPAGGANAYQALLIYPTAAGDGDHVHLTAGGGSTELYLGNDLHYVKLVDGGNIEIRTDDLLGNVGTWNFGANANLTLPETGYLRVGTGIVAGFASSPAPIISGFSSISAENFKFQGNGVNILSTVAGTYSNTNVAAYLTTNSTVTALQANLGATQIWANANIASLQANLGVTQLWANANIASINANIGGFYTWANTNFGTSSYGNTNANALLSSNTISTINTTGDIKTIANVIGTTFTFANGVNILSTATGQYSNNTVISFMPTYTGNIAGNIVKSGHAWRFGTDGNLTIPENINFANGVNILSTATGLYSNNTVISFMPTYTGNIAGNIVKGGYAYRFGTDGNLTLPETGYLRVGAGITYANGTSILDGIGGTYTNSNVASYLALGTDATILGLIGNTTASNTAIVTANSAVVSYINTKTTSLATGANTNTAAYLAANISTNIGTTGNVYAGNVIVNGQPTTYGYVNTTVVANTSPVSGTNFNGGSSVSPALTVMTVAIPTAGTWRLDAEMRVYIPGEGYMAAGFYNNGTLISGSEYFIAAGGVTQTGAATGQYGGFMSYNLTTTGATTVTMGAWATGTSQFITSDDGRTWLQATLLNPSIAVQATATGTLNTDYINAGRTTSDQTSMGNGSDIIFNGSIVSSGISLNTSTGVFTLTAGKTYKLFAELSFTIFSSNVGFIIYDWVDATTNTRLDTSGVSAGVGQAINRDTSEFNATSTTLIYTPTTNQTVKVRIVDANGTVTVRADIGTKAIIEQIANTFALNALATMSVTGNVTANNFIGNGSQLTGITAGTNYTNSNVATFLASFGSNTISTTGNVTANYFIGNGSQLTGITAGTNYTNSNVATFLASFGTNTISTTGNVSAGNAILTGTSVTGVNSILAGPTFTPLANTMAGFVSNVNSYTQLTIQNKSTGADATTDFVATANNGSDTVNYLDLGIINGGYDNGTPTNSLGNIVFAADSYIYAQGNTSATGQSGGNLAIGTTVATKTVKIFAGGVTSNSIVASFANTGANITGSLNVSGNITGANISGNISVTGNIQGTSSNVSLVAGSYTTTFDNTGVATFPGNITTSGNFVGNGASLTGVAVRTTGTWTVATGTNTYSITVPINGAYQIWVRCNIPNGIIAYQATVHVTNTNVPVLGTQRGYNYTGGGSPILLTTMPTQIVGAEGTISTTVVATTTANRFDFVIDNTSGSSQTVSWGYVTL